MTQQTHALGGRFYVRYAIATALFACTDGDGAPVLHTFCGALFVQLDDRVIGKDGNDFAYPDLGSLLDDMIHPIAAGNALQECDRKRRFDRPVDTWSDLHLNDIFAGRLNDGGELTIRCLLYTSDAADE